MPKISVIVATYARPKTLLRLLDILNNQLRIQTAQGIDVCVVDDGSPQDMTETFPKYHFPFTYIYRPRHPDNVARVYSARNIAAKNTTGQMILQLDDDVTFHERTLSELQNMASLFEFFAPNMNWLMTPRISNNIDRETSMGDDRAGFHRGFDGLWRDGKVTIMPTAWPSCDSSMMFCPRRTWEKVGGYSEELDGSMGAGDQEFALKVAKAGGLIILAPYFAHKEDEETESWRERMIKARKRPESNEELMRQKHPDQDEWDQFDKWAKIFDIIGETEVVLADE